MPEIKQGTVTIIIPDALALPPEAGTLSVKEVRSIAKTRRGVGAACEATADALSKLDGRFAPPAGVTADSLRAAGARAEGIDQVISDLEVLLQTLKQANLLFDADAASQLRRVNDQVSAQGKHDAGLETAFAGLRTWIGYK
ncbi:MAG: hypothetical protein AMXMBFR23_28410 [Chloroflexota bacterium]